MLIVQQLMRFALLSSDIILKLLFEQAIWADIFFVREYSSEQLLGLMITHL